MKYKSRVMKASFRISTRRFHILNQKSLIFYQNCDKLYSVSQLRILQNFR